MKLQTTFVTMLISLAVFGQDTLNSKTSAEFKRLLFGVNISPDYCYRTLKGDDRSSSIALIIDMQNKNEEPKIGYTAGLNLCYNKSKHLGIELGVQYSNKGYASKKSDLTFGDIIDPRFGFVYSTNSSSPPTKAKYFYNHIYIDIPVRAIFSFGEKRIHFITSIGVATNILLKATTTSVLEYENGDTKQETHDQRYNFNSLNISPTISVGIDCKISNKINLRVEPTLRYGLLKIIDAPISAYLWSGGLNLTCYYVLK